jgi:Uma2 family endonuclease
VRAVFVEVPQELLDHRRATGIDRYDEMWEGVLHMAPAPRINHQAIVAALIMAFGHATRGQPLLVVDGINICDPADVTGNYRVPDVCVLDRGFASVGDDFGRSEGIVLVVEVRLPRDETYDKLEFYAARNIAELVVIDVAMTRTEVYVLDCGVYTPTEAVDGWSMTSLGVAVRIDTDGQVAIRWVDGTEQLI